jgi:endonuclease/exonuclease/phosphatase family metal-dependent hydrolase
VPSWRITTWNLLGSASPDLAPIAAELDRLAPDAVALQEVRRGQARRLARSLGWRWTWARKHYPYGPLWWRAEGLAVLSPHRLERPHRAVISTGTRIWSWRHRVLLAVTVVRPASAPPADALRLVDVHLASHRDTAERLAQARVTTALGLADSALLGLPVVIAGDLNSHGDVELLDAFAAATPMDTWSTAHPGAAAPTNPSDAPNQTLDHILVPEGTEVLEVTVPPGGPAWRAMSDHLPVTATLRLRPGPL